MNASDSATLPGYRPHQVSAPRKKHTIFVRSLHALILTQNSPRTDTVAPGEAGATKADAKAQLSKHLKGTRTATASAGMFDKTLV